MEKKKELKSDVNMMNEDKESTDGEFIVMKNNDIFNNHLSPKLNNFKSPKRDFNHVNPPNQ